MARTYLLNLDTRLINWILAGMTRGGVGAPYRHSIIVRDRRTGRLHSTPVDVIEAAGDQWLVAGYGLSGCRTASSYELPVQHARAQASCQLQVQRCCW